MDPHRQNLNQVPQVPAAEATTKYIGRATVLGVVEVGPGWNDQVGQPGFSAQDGYTTPREMGGGATVATPTVHAEEPTVENMPTVKPGSTLEELDLLPAVSEEVRGTMVFGEGLGRGAAFPVTRNSGRRESWRVDKIVYDPKDGRYKVVVHDRAGEHFKALTIEQAWADKRDYNQQFMPPES